MFCSCTTECPVVTYDPPDADHSYNVKVMLLSAPPPEDLFEKTCHFADSGERSFFMIILAKHGQLNTITELFLLSTLVGQVGTFSRRRDQ